MITFFEKHNKLSWFVTILGAVGIFILSSLTFGYSTQTTSNLSIIYHFSAFFLFAFFLFISVKARNNLSIFILAFVIAIFYGISDEVHQLFVPGRECTLFDMIIDTTGILLASISYMIFVRLKN